MIDAIFGLISGSGLLQYPDVKLYNAAARLKPEDRPTVPVRLIDPDPKKHPLFRYKKDIEGTVDFGKRTIHVNREGAGYKSGDLDRLAGTLAHEGEHIRRMDAEEAPAYKRQYDALIRMGVRNSPYLQAIKDRSIK